MQNSIKINIAIWSLIVITNMYLIANRPYPGLFFAFFAVILILIDTKAIK